MSRNYFIMRQQLKDFGIEISDNASDSEIKEKFYKLPITDGQVSELKKLGVSYETKMQWTRVSYDMTFGEAAKIIYNMPPEEKQLTYLENNKIKLQKGIELTYGYAYRLIKARERVIYESKASKTK